TFLYRPERKSRAGGGRIEMRSRRPFANGRPPGPAASGTDVSPAFRGRRTAEFRIRSRAPRSGGRRRGGRGRAAPARRATAAAGPGAPRPSGAGPPRRLGGQAPGRVRPGEAGRSGQQEAPGPDRVGARLRSAEDRGFEPRKGVSPNRISSAAP